MDSIRPVRGFGRRVAALVIVAALGPVVALVGQPSASAAGCHGSSCNGKSPVTMGCAADAVTINSVVDEDHASGGTFGRQVVQLRYSRSCNASWSRVTGTAGGTAAVTSSVAYMGGFKSSTQRSVSGPGSVYSKMRSGSAINSCGRTSYNHGAVIKVHCATAG
jgi:Protein of unknown function (DUF2690)